MCARRFGRGRSAAATLALLASTLLEASGGPLNVGGEDVAEIDGFNALRAVFAVKDSFLADGNVDFDKAERATGGAHAILLVSEDGQYIVKEMSDVDWDSLHEHLQAYTEHLRSQRDSLLPRFLTAFVRPSDGKKWVAMFNWLAGKSFSTTSRVYDLKGTTCSVEAGDRLVRMDLDDEKVPTLKDLNFVQNAQHLHMSADARTRIIQQMETDTQFLRSLTLMDYSLILRVMVVGQCDMDALNAVCPRKPDDQKIYGSFFQEHNGYLATVSESERLMYVYSFGIIDVLQPYNWFKSQASWFKRIKCGHTNGKKEIRDTVDADRYQERFVEYFRERIVGDARLLSSDECEAVRNPGSQDAACRVVDVIEGHDDLEESHDREFGLLGLWLATLFGCAVVAFKLRSRTVAAERLLASQNPASGKVELAFREGLNEQFPSGQIQGCGEGDGMSTNVTSQPSHQPPPSYQPSPVHHGHQQHPGFERSAAMQAGQGYVPPSALSPTPAWGMNVNPNPQW